MLWETEEAKMQRTCALHIGIVFIAELALSFHSEAAVYLNDNFSTYANGNLVGQNGWTQLGATSTLPLQVNSGMVVIPGAQSADNQDAWKDNTAGVIPAPAAG